jgi:hypothetical protein
MQGNGKTMDWPAALAASVACGLVLVLKFALVDRLLGAGPDGHGGEPLASILYFAVGPVPIVWLLLACLAAGGASLLVTTVQRQRHRIR